MIYILYSSTLSILFQDKERHRPDHADYNPHTLYVPKDFLDAQSPGQRQWWELKAQYFDVVLFFKLGKFYEMFHMDADVGVQELNLIYMKVRTYQYYWPYIEE